MTYHRTSPAKVNIGLQVLGKRRDGHHDIHTIFQELELHDDIYIQVSDEFNLTSNVSWFPTDSKNTCSIAYRLLKDKFPHIDPVHIHVDKSIPAGGGLGGGSGNAAEVILGLDDIFDLGMTITEMEEMGNEIGADVPFFIRGGTQLGDGKGDILQPLKKSMMGTYLLVIPDIHIDTAWAYRSLKMDLEGYKQKCNFAGFIGKDPIPFEIFENDFERIVIPAHPEIGDIKAQLNDCGAYYTSLSGSGSTVYGIFDDEGAAKAVESNFQKHYHTVLTHPVRI